MWQGSEVRGYRCTVAMQAKEKGMMAVMASFTPIFCLRHLALLQRREISKVAEPSLLRRNRKLLRTRADLSASRIFRSNGWFLQREVVAERRAMPARIISGLEPRHREIVRREMLAWIPTDPRFIRRLPAPTSASFALDGTEIARVVPLASPRLFLLLWKLTIPRPQPR
jgi:hypothetical protein